MSRSRPPELPPVLSRGLRYGQDWSRPGWLFAYDEKSGAKVWEIAVYPCLPLPGLEADIQAVYFKSMELAGNGTLLIENENNELFKVDLERRVVVR